MQRTHSWLFHVLLTLMLPAGLAQAQDGRPLRVEFEARALVDDYYVIPSGNHGVLMVFNDEDKGDKDEWTLLNYDASFTRRWSRILQFDKPFHFLGSDIDGQTAHCLFVSRLGTGRSIRLLTNDFGKDTLWQTDVELPDNLELQYFFVNRGRAFIMGYSAPKRKVGLLFSGTRYIPRMFIVDVYSGKLQDFTPANMSHHEIISAGLSASGSSLNVLLRDRKLRKPNQLILQVYSAEGTLMKESLVSTGKGHLFIDAKVIQTSSDDIIILGTYRGDRRSSDDFAEGLFMSLMSGYAPQFIRFYPFTGFDTFGKTISSRTARKVAKRKSKGKDVSIGFRMLIHEDIDTFDGQFIVQVEAFHPEYRTEYRYDPFYGYGQTVQVFEGWRFDHALLAGFGQDGELLWDQTLQMHNILEKGPELHEHVLLLEDQSDLIMVYTYDGNLYSLVVNEGKVVEGREKTSIDTGRQGDRVRANFNSGLEFWYNGYILVWGYQRIKTSGQRREVFYMNKISYR